MSKEPLTGDNKNGLVHRLQKTRNVHTMRKAFSLVRKRQKTNMNRIPDLKERKKRLRETREKSVGNEELIRQAVVNLEENGIKVYQASNNEEAIAIVRSEIGNEKLVVKSKSNITKEIGLTESLEKAGIDVIETDIGDRIIQLCGGVPSHPTGPASHLNRHDISRILSAHYKMEVGPTPETMVELLKNELAHYISKAVIGITGANAIAGNEGAILLLHNEGNIIEVAMRPEKHLIIAGTDKIYPDIEEAINMVKLQTYYATGSLSTSFINIISGPSKTADIEKQLFKGVHGAKEVCLILVDNHRSDIANSEYKELLYCIGCGECLLVCPAYGVYGSGFGIGSELGGRGVLYSILSREASAEASGGPDMCLTCRKCQKNCPLAIDTPSMIIKLRLDKRKRVVEPHLATAYDFVSSHINWIGEAMWLEAQYLISKLIPG